MSLRYALLALLTAQPMTGYDLAKSFGGSVGHVWQAPDSQIYPELRRMHADGLLDAEDVRWGRAGTKTQYSITAAGVADLRRWMTTPIDYPRERDPAHLRAAYFEFTDDERVRETLTAHIAHYEDMKQKWTTQRDAIRDRVHPVLVRRIAGVSEAESRRIIAYKVFTYEGLIAHADQEIDWARRGIALADEFTASDAG